MHCSKILLGGNNRAFWARNTVFLLDTFFLLVQQTYHILLFITNTVLKNGKSNKSCGRRNFQCFFKRLTSLTQTTVDTYPKWSLAPMPTFIPRGCRELLMPYNNTGSIHKQDRKKQWLIHTNTFLTSLFNLDFEKIFIALKEQIKVVRLYDTLYGRSSSTPDQWEDFSNHNILNAEKQCQNSQALRSVVDGILQATYNDMAHQRDAVNLAMTLRIAETRDTKEKLEDHLNKVGGGSGMGSGLRGHLNRVGSRGCGDRDKGMRGARGHLNKVGGRSGTRRGLRDHLNRVGNHGYRDKGLRGARGHLNKVGGGSGMRRGLRDHLNRVGNHGYRDKGLRGARGHLNKVGGGSGIYLF